jgi:hypothetical protein
MTSRFKILLAAGISSLAFGAGTASAQTEGAQADSEAIKSANEIVVQGQIGFRNRSEDTEPKLVYDTDYFQRFEPLTAGDALKRVPSVTFLSDVIESDGARLRGLDPGYTQILINGDKVPGSNADRSFFLDRIPAELISRVEIVRSSSARRTGDAVAGTLNIVLRDGYQLDGGYVRGGALRFRDDKVVPSVGAVYGGAIGESRLLIGANVQGRYNPKLKQSFRYSDSPENNPDYATDDFVDREDQTDTRDGMDYAFNATWGINTGSTDVELSAFYVRNNRTETERSRTYDDPTAITGSVRGAPAGNLLSDNANVNDIDQDNYSLAGKLRQDWALGKTTLKLGYARFVDHQRETEFEIEFDRAAPRLPATSPSAASPIRKCRSRSTISSTSARLQTSSSVASRRTRIATPISRRCASASTCRSPCMAGTSSRRIRVASSASSRALRPSRAGSTESRKTAATRSH